MVHVTRPGGDTARCGATYGEILAWEDAIAPGGEPFTCGACYAELTGGHSHVPAPGTDRG
jgi:hypothetical protein